MTNWVKSPDGTWVKGTPGPKVSPAIPDPGKIPSLNLDAVSRHGYLKSAGSEQAWSEKQLRDVMNVGSVLDQSAAAGDPVKLAKLTLRRMRIATNQGLQATKLSREISAEERIEAAKDIAGDNWAAIAGLGAAIGDVGHEIVSSATDVAGKAMKIGVAGDVVATLGFLVDTIRSRQPHLVKNPRFVHNGWDDAESPRTKTYLRNRILKKAAGGGVSLIGSVAATWSAVNVLGLARHTRAVANTIAHLHYLRMESERMKQSEYFQMLMRIIIQAKMLKLLNRGGALAADAIPGIAVASAAVSAATGIPSTIGMMTLNKAMTFASIELHWRAFVEQRMLRVQGSPGRALGGPPAALSAAPAATGAATADGGPALRVVDRLYHGLVSENRWAGPQPHEFIVEPAGWMVLRDKMSLL